jgi:hypothetical protein
MDTVEHAWLHELFPCDVGIFVVEFNFVPNLLHLMLNEEILLVPSGMDQCQSSESFLPAAVFGKPTGGFRENE